MPKRMTDTEKWKKPFFKTLPVEYKLLWIYILDDCDHAGIWQVDMEVAELRLGVKLSQERAQGYFAKNIVVFSSGTKWFIPDFISFQYGAFNEANKMYRSIIPTLQKYGLMGDISPINGVKVQVQVKDKVKESLSSEETERVRGWAEALKKDRLFLEQVCQAWALTLEACFRMVEDFLLQQASREKEWKDYSDFKNHFFNWGAKKYTSYLQGKTSIDVFV